MNKPWWLSHFIRWSLILIMLCFIIAGFTSHPFNLQKAIKGSLINMELPTDVEITSVAEDKGLYSVLYTDKQNNLYHQSDFKKYFGIFWVPAGGAFGYEKDPSILAKYQSGMSTHGKEKFYYVMGYVQDPEVKTVRIDWGDGKVKETTPVDDLYQFVKTTESNDNIFGLAHVEFYDTNDKLLYSLDYENNQLSK